MWEKEEEKTTSEENEIGRWVLFGVEMTPEVGAILLVYFVQGVLGISRLAMSFFLKDELGLSPSEAAALTGITTIPWLVKPLYGFLSDSIPLLGYRRRSYLVISGLLGSLSWTLLGTSVSTPLQAVSASFFASLSVAFSDVVADSMVVERVRGQVQGEAGKLQSLCWGSVAVGGLLSSYFSGSLLEYVNPRRIFQLTAILPLLTSSVAFAITEKQVKSTSISQLPDQLGGQFQRLWHAFREKKVWMPTLFIFLWQASPSPDSAFFYFTTNELHFQPEFLGRVRLISSAASLVGVGLYQKFLRDVPLKKMLVTTTWLSIPLGLTQLILVLRLNQQLGLPDQWFALGDSALLTVLGQVAFMPTLVLAASICPPGVEGTLFAALMSIYNASGTLSTELGAFLTQTLGVNESNFERLPLLIVLCTLSSLVALPFARFIDVVEPAVEKSKPIFQTTSAKVPATPLENESKTLAEASRTKPNEQD